MLALKLLLVPSLIGAISLAARRFGPAVAGWLSGFPIVSAPILYFVAREQGSLFAATAAAATLSAVPAVLVYVLTYARTAQRAPWPVCLIAALATYALAFVAIYFIAPPIFLAAPVIFFLIWISRRFAPQVVPPKVTPAITPLELATRMAAGAALVVGLTYFAADLGEQLTGLFAMFPVLGIVLSVSSHRHSGALFTVNLMRGMLFGFYAFAAFCLVLALSLPRTSIDLAFLLALGVAAVVQTGVRLYLRSGGK